MRGILMRPLPAPTPEPRAAKPVRSAIAWITDWGLRAIVLSIVLQTWIFGQTDKYYISVFGASISLLDGLVPSLCILILFAVAFSGAVFVDWVRMVSPLAPYACWVALTVGYGGIAGKGGMRLLQTSLQVFTCFIGFAYANSLRRNPPLLVRRLSKLFRSLLFLVAVSDCAYIAGHGLTVKSAEAAGRYGTTFGTYVTVSYFAAVMLIVSGGEWLWLKRMGRQGKRGTGALIVSLAASLLLILAAGRTSLAASIAAFGVGSIRLGISKRLVMSIAVALLGCAWLWQSGVQSRFTTGSGEDRAINLGLTGRGIWYRTVWDSAWNHPWTGGGAGTADDLVFAARSGRVYSTHSQHLEILHDYGLIGTVLFFVGFLGIIWRLRGRARLGPGSAGHLILTWAIMYCIHLIISMTVDSVFPASLYYGNYGAFILGAALSVVSQRYPVVVPPSVLAARGECPDLVRFTPVLMGPAGGARSQIDDHGPRCLPERFQARGAVPLPAPVRFFRSGRPTSQIPHSGSPLTATQARPAPTAPSEVPARSDVPSS